MTNQNSGYLRAGTGGKGCLTKRALSSPWTHSTDLSPLPGASGLVSTPASSVPSRKGAPALSHRITHPEPNPTPAPCCEHGNLTQEGTHTQKGSWLGGSSAEAAHCSSGLQCSQSLNLQCSWSLNLQCSQSPGKWGMNTGPEVSWGSSLRWDRGSCLLARRRLPGSLWNPQAGEGRLPETPWDPRRAPTHSPLWHRKPKKLAPELAPGLTGLLKPPAEAVKGWSGPLRRRKVPTQDEEMWRHEAGRASPGVSAVKATQGKRTPRRGRR